MTKRASEAELGTALRAMDFDPTPLVYRLPDPKTGAGIANWKPCDFMVWCHLEIFRDDGVAPYLIAASVWVEAKDTDQVDTFPFADLRPSQRAGIRDADRQGIRYLLAVYWRRAKRWTISDGVAVLRWFEDVERPPTSIPRTLLMSRFGVESSPANLSQTIRIVLEEGW